MHHCLHHFYLSDFDRDLFAIVSTIAHSTVSTPRDRSSLTRLVLSTSPWQWSTFAIYMQQQYRTFKKLLHIRHALTHSTSQYSFNKLSHTDPKQHPADFTVHASPPCRRGSALCPFFTSNFYNLLGTRKYTLAHSTSYYTLDKLPHIRQASTHSTSLSPHASRDPPTRARKKNRGCRPKTAR